VTLPCQEGDEVLLARRDDRFARAERYRAEADHNPDDPDVTPEEHDAR
jgi:hypothetical protein